MGHVTIVADDAEAVDRAVAVVKAHGRVVPRESRKQEE
jgi:hypothetical protein